MKKSFGNYRLLVKGGSRIRGSIFEGDSMLEIGASIWEGPDHLLEIVSSGILIPVQQSYRRFDYRNIQSVSYTRTRRGMWTTIVYLIALALLSWGIVGFWRDSRGASIWFLGLAAVLLIALIVHLLRGPTCICKMQTAVQTRKLRSLDRLRKAERFVQRVSELCTAHQAGVQAAASPVSVAGAMPSSTGAFAVHQTAALPDSLRFKEPWTGSKLVTSALVLLIISGTVTIADVFITGLPFFLLDFLLGVTAYVLVIAGLARSVKYDLPGGLSVALKSSVATFVLSIITGYGLIMTAGFEMTRTIINRGGRPSIASQDNMAVYRYLADAGFEELGWAAWLVIGLGAAAVFLGLLGLPAALRPGAKAGPAPAPPPLPPLQPPAPTMESPP